MKTIEINKHKIEIYDSSHSLPIKRYQKFQKHMMIDNEVGSSFEDFDKRTNSVVEFLKKEMIKEALIELENRRQSVYQAFEEYSPKGMAMAILVRKIDDVVYNDLSEETLKSVIDHLDRIGFNRMDLVEQTDGVKKKLMKNLQRILRGSKRKPHQSN